MSLYVLDTDQVSLSQRQHPFVLQRMAEVGRNSLATTIITVEEQIQGRFQIIKRASGGEKLIGAYADLQNTIGYFTTFQVLPFDSVANVYYEALQRQKVRIGTQDLRIAAIVLSVRGILVTRNWRDFGKISDLVLEDWSSGKR